MEYRWELSEAADEQKVKALAGSLNNLHSVLTSILLRRGVDTFEEAKKYFRPSLDDLHDPFLMKDMDLAVERLQKAMDEGENILIYGDYDVDGVTSVSLVYSFLKERYDRLGYYIPDRYAEGYGISIQGIDYAGSNGFSLIIALDCGIKAVEKVAYAREKGIDFIICDHHQPGAKLPEAVAVLDPKREDCNYPYKELSGCGVGFKLLQAYAVINRVEPAELMKYLDFLAISIAADIVPITGENRVLAAHGLELINRAPRQGISSMIGLAGLKKALSITDVVFKIAPRINAAGRLKSATSAVEVLIADHETVAMEAGKFIHDQNEDRKRLDQEITGQALELIEADTTFLQRKTTVVYHPEWHKGVIGIVASRLIERHYRPTIVLTRSNGKITGSARSVQGFNVYEAIECCSDLLEQFGGHKYAAGLTLHPDHLDRFRDAFDKAVTDRIRPEMLTPVIEVESVLKLGDIDARFFRILQQFEPFGPGNMNPVFLTKGVLAAERRIVGQTHLKLKLFDPDTPSRLFEAIGFGLGKYFEQIDDGIPFDVVYSLEVNEWNGQISMQLNLKDIRL